MLIDWFTVGAQAINFLVLLWLMKRFLYRPILAAIDAREKRIADELASAEKQQSRADALRQDLLAKNSALDADRARLMSQAVADVNVEHERLLTQLRADAAKERSQQQALWQRERTSQGDVLNRLVSTEVFAIARRALTDLAGVELEERMVETMLTRQRDLRSSAKDSWIVALQSTSQEHGNAAGKVRSRFDLTPTSRTLIQTAMNDFSSSAVQLNFETATNGICGIEIIVAGQRVAWTIDDYLNSLQAQVATLGFSSMATAPAAGDLDATDPTLTLAVA